MAGEGLLSPHWCSRFPGFSSSCATNGRRRLACFCSNSQGWTSGDGLRAGMDGATASMGLVPKHGQCLPPPSSLWRATHEDHRGPSRTVECTSTIAPSQLLLRAFAIFNYDNMICSSARGTWDTASREGARLAGRLDPEAWWE